VNTEITSYGSGSFFHFFIWAIPVFGIGFLFLLKSTWLNAHTMVNRLKIDWKSSSVSEDSKNFILKHQVIFWLVLGSFWGYFMAHTVLWWQGMWASLGLLRVMFVVAVPMVLLALIELNKFLDNRPLTGSWKTIHVIIVLLCGTAFGTNTLILGAVGAPVEYGIEESVLNAMKGWMKAEGVTTQGCVFAGHSYVSLALDRDPFDYTKMNQLRAFKYAQKGDLIVWDGHYGPNEENTPIEMMERDTTLTFLKEFRPVKEYRPLNDMPFYVRLYRKK
jgi:hypothetical protein